jgi:hypothetical protein
MMGLTGGRHFRPRRMFAGQDDAPPDSSKKENVMKTFTACTLLAALAAVSLAMTAPSFAKTTRYLRAGAAAAVATQSNPYEAYASAGAVESGMPITADGSRLPGYVVHERGECFLDQGYGRWTSCGAGN